MSFGALSLMLLFKLIFAQDVPGKEDVNHTVKYETVDSYDDLSIITILMTSID